MANEYATRADLKNYLSVNQDAGGNLASGRDDSLLDTLLTSVSRMVDRYCGWSFYQETLTLVYSRLPSIVVDSNGWLILNTHKPNITSVTALGYKTSATTATYTSVPLNNVVLSPVPSVDDATPNEFNSYQIRVTGDTVDWLQYRNGGGWGYGSGWYGGRWNGGNLPLWVQVSFVGGYATVPQPIFEATREWAAYTYKLREAIPMSVVSFPQMGVTVRPMGIPPHIEMMLNSWRRVWQ